MNYLLDTNIIIFFFKGKFGIGPKMKEIGIDHCFISEITLAELKYGAANSENFQKHTNEINLLLKSVKVAPIISSLDLFAKEKARLRKAGTMIDNFDLLIGCTAVANEMVLVTNNVKHFQRIDTIELEEWTTPTN
ncbi:MAG: type II toxin-antitoxin system VapC family toxin [Bacteroidota bacterium]